MIFSATANQRAILAIYAPLLLWIGVIFFLSSGSGSMEHTSRFIRPLLEFLFPSAAESTLQLYHSYIRKSAHFTEYAILGLLAARLFITLNLLKWPLISFALCAVIAALDEFNQSYIQTRTGSPYDVLLDCLGACFGVGVIWYINYRRSIRVLSE